MTNLDKVLCSGLGAIIVMSVDIVFLVATKTSVRNHITLQGTYRNVSPVVTLGLVATVPNAGPVLVVRKRGADSAVARFCLNDDTSTSIQINVAVVSPLGFRYLYPTKPVIGSAVVATVADHRVGSGIAAASVSFDVFASGD